LQLKLHKTIMPCGKDHHSLRFVTTPVYMDHVDPLFKSQIKKNICCFRSMNPAVVTTCDKLVSFCQLYLLFYEVYKF